jgi:hypothetical protein
MARSTVEAGDCGSDARFVARTGLVKPSSFVMRPVFASSLALALLLAPAAASAQCALRDDPDAPPGSCFEEDVAFHDAFAAIPSVSLDSGWVPASSPLQVRFALYVMAETAVDLGGTVVASWPTHPAMRALSVAVPGRPGMGRLSMAYGIELVAQVRIHVTVAGVTYDWEGDIPIPGGIPSDLRLVGETMFDPFVLPDAMPRPVTVTDVTDSIPIVTASIGSLAGGSIPGIDGGFELSARGMLTTSYQSQRIDVERALSSIISEGAWVAVPPEPMTEGTGFGASEDMVVLPHGTIGYDGVITLRPALYVELAGSRWDLLAFDVPLHVVELSTDTDFEPANVHVPLPDVRIAPDAIDLGRVLVGETAEGSVDIVNDGEAELVVELVEPGHGLTAIPSSMTLAPRSRRAMTITYTPTDAEMLSTLVSLTTNDPDRALAAFRVTALAELPPDAGMRDGGLRGDASIGGGPSTAGGCACRAGSRSPAGGAAVLSLALTLLMLRRALSTGRGQRVRARSRARMRG